MWKIMLKAIYPSYYNNLLSWLKFLNRRTEEKGNVFFFFYNGTCEIIFYSKNLTLITHSKEGKKKIFRPLRGWHVFD